MKQYVALLMVFATLLLFYSIPQPCKAEDKQRPLELIEVKWLREGGKLNPVLFRGRITPEAYEQIDYLFFYIEKEYSSYVYFLSDDVFKSLGSSGNYEFSLISWLPASGGPPCIDLEHRVWIMGSNSKNGNGDVGFSINNLNLPLCYYNKDLPASKVEASITLLHTGLWRNQEGASLNLIAKVCHLDLKPGETAWATCEYSIYEDFHLSWHEEALQIETEKQYVVFSNVVSIAPMTYYMRFSCFVLDSQGEMVGPDFSYKTITIKTPEEKCDVHLSQHPCDPH